MQMLCQTEPRRHQVPEAGVQVRAWPRPLSPACEVRSVAPGLTVGEILDGLGWEPQRLAFASVEIGDPLNRAPGWPIAPALWDRVRPNPGTEMRVWVVPQGGGGKNPLKTILSLAVMAAAAVFAAPLGAAILGGASATIFGATVTAFQVGSALIGVVGNLLINALVPPATPKFSTAGSRRESPTLSITGARNQPIGFGPIPRVYGRHKIVPPRFPAITESDGKEQYLRMLFVFGYGPLALTDLRIGATPIDEFEDVDYNILPGQPDDPPLAIYTRNTVEDALSLLLESGEGQVVASREDAIEIGYEFAFQGLGKYGDNGSVSSETVTVTVEYRVEGAATWTAHATHDITAATNQIYRKAYRITGLAAARYELRFTKTSADSTSNTVMNTTVLSAVRSVRPGEPVKKSGLCMVEMRIRASGQLNGVIDEFSAIATSILPVWTGTVWEEQETRHPAAVFRNILQGPANRRPLADSRIDLDRLQQWMEDDPDRKFDAVIDYAPTVRELLHEVCGASRAAPDMVNGQYTVVRDVPQSVPVQHFGPRNILKFSGQKAFHRKTHGLKVRFISEDSDYRWDERTVYAPGYDETNATEFETLEVFGVTDPEQAYKDALFHMAVVRLRPENFDIEVDLDHLVCTRGDLVKLVHDVPQIGLRTARVTAVTDDGTHATAIVIDDAAPMEAGKSYAVEIRRADGVEIVAPVQTVAGEQTTLTFSTPILLANGPAAGDLLLFGESGAVSMPCLVKAIRSGGEERARLTLNNYHAGVYTADTGTIPAYVPLTTPDPTLVTPSAVRSLTLSEVLRYPSGRAVSDVVADWQPPLTGVPAVYRVFRRVLGDGTWTHVTDTTGQSVVIATDVAVGTAEEVGVVAVSPAGRALQPAAMATASLTTAGDIFPPAAVDSLTVEEITDGIRRIRWEHTGGEPDLAGFEVRVRPGASTTWETAVPLHTGLLSANLLETRAISAGQQTVLIKAVDTAGNRSATATSATVTLGDVLAQNLIETTDYRADGWTGTITNGAVGGGGGLVGGDTGTLFWPADGDALFWPTDGDALFWDVDYLTMAYQDQFTTATGGPLLLEAAGTGEILLDWRPDGATVWRAYAGRVEVAAGTYDLRVRVVPAEGAAAELDQLKAHIDVPDILETVSGAAIADTGTRLTLARTYTQIKNVVLSVQESGAETAVTARVVDRSTSGPLVKCFDASGTAVAGTVDAIVQGY